MSDIVRIQGEEHRLNVLISTINQAKNINIKADQLVEFNPNERTNEQLDEANLAVIQRGDKYVLLNGRMHASRLIKLGVGVDEGKPLLVKLIASDVLKKSILEKPLSADEIDASRQALAARFNSSKSARHQHHRK